MFLSKLSINRPVMVTMGLMVLVVFGLMAYFGLSLNLMPDASVPYVTIQTIYPGAGPTEVETQITKKIEDEISTISKIDFIDSYSLDNASLIVMSFELGKDSDVAVAEVKQKVDAILSSLPESAKRPSVKKMEIGAFSVMEIILTGDLSGRDLFEIADKQLKEQFSQIDGVAQVNITGGQEREIHVKLDDRIVVQNMISLPQLSQILAAHNMDMPGGQFQQEDQEYSVRLEGKLKAIESLNELDIPTAFGTKKLRQIANVSDSGEEIRKRSIYFNNITKDRNNNVVQLSIMKTSEGNPVSIANAVRAKLETIAKTLPVGSELQIVIDTSEYVQDSVSDTMKNVLLGILFTGIVLLFFLHDLRSTLIVAVSMPVSIVATFVLMQVAGFSLNLLSLMGLSTSVGILVTNAVVVLENIFRHKEMGHNRRVAADNGTAETTVAVMASALTNIVVFVPLAMMNTLIGTMLKEFAMTVVFATIISLVVSFTLTPMLASLILPEEKKKGKLGEKFESMFHHWERNYKKTLAFIIKNKGISLITIFVAFGLFVITLMTIGPSLGFELFPSTDEGMIRISYELPVGYNLDETAGMYDKIEKIITAHPEVKHILVSIGKMDDTTEGVNMATMNVTLVDTEERDVSTDELVGTLIEELSVVSNLKVKVSSAGSMGGGMEPIQFYLQGPDLAVLSELTEEFITKSKKINGLINFDSNLKAGKPEITLIPKRDKLAVAGVTIYDIAMSMRASIEGLTATTYTDNGEDYDVIISLNEESVNTPEEVKNIPVVTQHGIFRISQLADVKFTNGATKIVHRNKVKSSQFNGGIAHGFAQGDIMEEITKLQAETELPEGYIFNWGGMSDMMQENTYEMSKAFMIAILLTYMLLAAILESFTKPILILLTMPLAIIGVLLSLYLTGLNLGMMVMMGIIMLLGIVVNAAILLMDYTQQLRNHGKSTHDALMEACPTKLKPILMSAVAIIFGMLPMALGIGDAGAEMRQPLGIVSIGGIIVSTLMTLYVIPALYYLTTNNRVKIQEKV